MQPFDGQAFDLRYRETFAPAIEAAGLTPYRVDLDPRASIPIQDIEQGIRNARLCLAEITLDNPNVWFELGFALACKKEVVLICSDERSTRFPFDIQHRHIIKYNTKSASGYKQLEQGITQRIRAQLDKFDSLATTTELSSLTTSDDLEHHEIVALAALTANLQYPDDAASMYQIRRDMNANGLTDLAATIALKGMLIKNYIECTERQDEYAQTYTAYGLTAEGWKWVMANKRRFKLEHHTPADSGESIPF